MMVVRRFENCLCCGSGESATGCENCCTDAVLPASITVTVPSDLPQICNGTEDWIVAGDYVLDFVCASPDPCTTYIGGSSRCFIYRWLDTVTCGGDSGCDASEYELLIELAMSYSPFFGGFCDLTLLFNANVAAGEGSPCSDDTINYNDSTTHEDPSECSWSSYIMNNAGGGGPATVTITG